MGKNKLKAFKEARLYWLLISIFVLLYFTFDNLTYRRYIYENDINDFGLAANGTNFFSVFVFQLFYFISADYDREKFKHYCLKICGILVLYEVSQLWIEYLTFDWFDILSTLIASAIAYVTLRYLAERRGSKEQLES